MTDAKVYLSQLKLIDARIDTKLEEVWRLKTLLFHITSTIKPISVSSTKRHDRTEELIAKIEDLNSEIDGEIDALVDKRHEIGKLLDKLQDDDEMKVLRKLYCEYKKWPQIAKEMHMSERNAQYIHGRALRSVRLLLANGAMPLDVYAPQG